VNYTASPAGAVIEPTLVLGGSSRTFAVGGSGVGSDALTVSGLISSTSGLIKTGTGRLVLSSAASTYSGKTTIQSGVLEVSSLSGTGVASSLGAPTTAANARIDLGTGTTFATLRYTGTGGHSTNRPIFLAGSAGGGGILDASGSGPVSFTGGVTGAAGTTLTLTGSNTDANSITAVTGSNVTKTGAGTWVLGSNSFTGRLTIEQGTIVAAMDAPGGSGTSSSLGRQNGPIPLLGLADTSGTAALLAANGVTISRVVEVAALGSGSQEVVLGGSGAGTATFDANSAFRLGRGVTLAADAGGNVRFLTPTANWDQQDGSENPAVAITIGTPTATGTVTLETTLPNSITQVTVRQGTLRLGNGTTVGALGPSSVLTGSAGATLAFDRSNTVTSGVDFASTIGGAMNVTQLGSGTLVLAGLNTYTGTTSIAAGAIRVSGSGRIASSARIDVGAAGRIVFDRSDDYGGAYDGKLTGSGLLSVQSGSLTLTGLNTFAGSSEVLSGAVLQLDGQINNATLDIDSGATLMGSGTILGTTTIAGLHRPGNSPGIQTLQNLSYLSGASVEWELWSNTILNNVTPPDYDQVMLSGNLDFAGATAFNLVFTGSSGPSNFSEVEWANAFWDEDREWLVYDVAGTTTGFGNLSLVQTNWQDSTGMLFNNIRSMASFRLEKRVSNDVYLVYSSIPEPSSLALAGIGLAAAAWTARRRRR
jgi:autotransporter-associated beta strand protein